MMYLCRMLLPANELLRLFLATNQMRLCDRAPSDTTWSRLLGSFLLFMVLAIESTVKTRQETSKERYVSVQLRQ